MNGLMRSRNRTVVHFQLLAHSGVPKPSVGGKLRRVGGTHARSWLLKEPRKAEQLQKDLRCTGNGEKESQREVCEEDKRVVVEEDLLFCLLNKAVELLFDCEDTLHLVSASSNFAEPIGAEALAKSSCGKTPCQKGQRPISPAPSALQLDWWMITQPTQRPPYASG